MHFEVPKIDLNATSSLLVMGSSFLALIAALNRHRIVKHWKRMLSSLRRTSELVSENERLTDDLAASEQRNTEWAAALENIDQLRAAMGRQLEQLTKEIADVRLRLSAKDDLIALLQADRDALLVWGRLLVGQLHSTGLEPDYPSPSLRSIVALPSAHESHIG